MSITRRKVLNMITMYIARGVNTGKTYVASNSLESLHKRLQKMYPEAKIKRSNGTGTALNIYPEPLEIIYRKA